MAQTVGVIGLGVIGRPIAERLLHAGFDVAVYDIRDEPVKALAASGAIACASSAAVARCSDIVISLVLDRAQTDDVVFGANGVRDAMRPDSVFVTGSTLGPQPVRDLAKALAERGCATLDMTITGGHVAANKGKLVLMLGADEATVARTTPLLRAFAHVIMHVGDVGAGQAAKVAHQLVMGVNVMALLEGLSLGIAAGVAPDAMKQVIRNGIADSGVLRLWADLGPRWKEMLKPAAPGTALPNMRKDLHTALELAQELGVELPLATHASGIADAGSATGRDDPRL